MVDTFPVAGQRMCWRQQPMLGIAHVGLRGPDHVEYLGRTTNPHEVLFMRRGESMRERSGLLANLNRPDFPRASRKTGAVHSLAPVRVYVRLWQIRCAGPDIKWATDELTSPSPIGSQRLRVVYT
jgi:hypothetical protein